MTHPVSRPPAGAVFITFPGNCEKALTHYQSCFGGTLHFELFTKKLPGHPRRPVVSGSLVSARIVIHGSDMMHNEGRMLGNYIAVFLPCKDVVERQMLATKLAGRPDVVNSCPAAVSTPPVLVELVDIFDVRWVLAI